MRIALISTVHEPFDVRIFYKNAIALSSAGHNVSIFSTRAAGREETKGIEIFPLRKRSTKIKRIVFSVFDVFLTPGILNYDVYHIFDPELVFAGFLLRVTGKPVVYEVLENVRGMVESRKWIGNKAVRSLFAQITWFFDRMFFRFFSYVIVARPDLKSLYRRKRVILINNYPDITLNFPEIETGIIKKEKKIILYSGGLTEVRGIFNLVKSMELLTCDAELWLLGPWLEDDLESRCKSLKGYDRVKYLGSFPFGEHYSFFKFADLGVVPFLPARNHITTLPNKPFEYFMFGIPVAMSDFPYWKKLFGGIAYFFSPESPSSIAKTVDMVFSDGEQSKIKIESAKKKIEEEMQWNLEKDKIIRIYDSFSAR